MEQSQRCSIIQYEIFSFVHNGSSIYADREEQKHNIIEYIKILRKVITYKQLFYNCLQTISLNANFNFLNKINESVSYLLWSTCIWSYLKNADKEELILGKMWKESDLTESYCIFYVYKIELKNGLI